MGANLSELIPNVIPNSIPSCIKTRGFKMAFLNIVSLPKHVGELRISELFFHFDLLALNETRVDLSISDGLYSQNLWLRYCAKGQIAYKGRCLHPPP